MAAPAIAFTDDELRVHFDRFGLDAYDVFLKVKRLPEYRLTFHPEDETYTVTAPARFASMLGVERPLPARAELPFNPALYDDQVHVVRTMLDAKRFAVWSDCGLGKTLIALEAGRQVIHRTGGRFMVVTINEVVGEWLEQAKKFYGDSLPLHRIGTTQEMRDFCAGRMTNAPPFGITNYEKFNLKGDEQVVSELRLLSGLALDENRLKTGGGVQKWSIGKSAKGIEYKFSLTATPAPNNAMEFASQAMFLEKMRTETEVIWTFFARDPQTQEWTVKPHARRAFFEWMASWSIYVRDPKRYGWRLDLPDVPAPEYVRVDIEPTPAQLDAAAELMGTPDHSGEQRTLFAARVPNAIERVKLSEIAKGFLYLKKPGGKKSGGRKVRRIPSNKPAAVARIVSDEVTVRDAQVLVWTVFDAESSELSDQLGRAGVDFELLTGKTPADARLETLERFRRGECRVLVSRGSLLGFGMNFQFVRAMVFSGWDDSYERFYQQVRRAVRHGQLERVRIYLPCVRELEDETLANLDRKAARVEAEIAEMEAEYVRVLKEVAA